MPLDLVHTLCDLVSIPSVNPMGRADLSAAGCEAGVTDYLEKTLRGLGLPIERQEVEPGRSNILARLEGSSDERSGELADGELIVWEVHQDTVPVDGMTIPPFAPHMVNGRLYGRGACDVKGGMASMLHALSRLVEQPPPRRPTIVFAATVNEEYGFSGARALARNWQGASRLLPRAPDGVIVAEPTDLDVIVAHKGAVRWRCETIGRAAHSSRPEQGDNAIFRMGRVLAALETYQRDVAPGLASHPRCGVSTLSVGVVRGGLSVNTVPDRCMIEIDRRLVPGEDPRVAYQAVIDFIAACSGHDAQVIHQEPFLSGAGLSDRHNLRLGERLLLAARATRPDAKLDGVPYGTDAAVLSTAGAPCVVFGPGSIAQAHTVDEWIELDALSAASDVLVRFAERGAV